MSQIKSPQPGQTAKKPAASSGDWLAYLSWGVAILMVALMVLLLLQRVPGAASVSAEPHQPQPEIESGPLGAEVGVSMPAFTPGEGIQAIVRSSSPHTIVPNRARREAIEYTVEKGDSIFGIATEFKLKPESILWANYAQLNDDPHMISVGQELTIPPTDGIYYKWEENDTLEKVAGRFKVKPEAILEWPSNKLDMTNPEIEPDKYVMIPGGQREFRQWVVPTIWRANAGASRSIPGGCTVPDGGAIGSGSFIWPANNKYLSGNDYWSGHLGIDIAAGTGAPIYAADSGVVVYAASIGGGYGLMVMIDHGNGYHTLYAHLSQIMVYCGQSVFQGNMIGLAGSTGNSTGPHLHFEVRQNGGFINPWYVLP